MVADRIHDHRAVGIPRVGVLCALALVMAVACSAAQAVDFVSLCEANQVYDTGKPTTDAERQICRCIKGKFGPQREGAAIEVFQKVLAARRNGLGLHPSQVDLDELIALMSFSDSLQACTNTLAAGHRGF